MTKKLLKERIGEFPVSDLTGNFSEIIETLKEKEEYYWSRHPEAEYFIIQFEMQDHEDSYSRYEQFVVYQNRLETDKECKERTQKKQQVKKEKEKEYKTYLKLKRKYEKSSK